MPMTLTAFDVAIIVAVTIIVIVVSPFNTSLAFPSCDTPRAYREA